MRPFAYLQHTKSNDNRTVALDAVKPFAGPTGPHLTKAGEVLELRNVAKLDGRAGDRGSDVVRGVVALVRNKIRCSGELQTPLPQERCFSFLMPKTPI